MFKKVFENNFFDGSFSWMSDSNGTAGSNEIMKTPIERSIHGLSTAHINEKFSSKTSTKKEGAVPLNQYKTACQHHPCRIKM